MHEESISSFRNRSFQAMSPTFGGTRACVRGVRGRGKALAMPG
jgi:hypothetical protein